VAGRVEVLHESFDNVARNAYIDWCVALYKYVASGEVR
jgi:hypothetical protein